LISIERRARFLAMMAPLLASVLGGCASSETAMNEPATPATVVVTSPPVTVTRPADTVIVTQPSSNVISYPEGSYQLQGDATRGRYWVWVPAGSTAAWAPPVPPAVPRITNNGSAVLAAGPQRVIAYPPHGRYELHGDATTGYYWVWFPGDVMVRVFPPPPPF